MRDRQFVGKVLLWAAVCSGCALVLNGTPQAGVAVYGATAGAVVGSVRLGVRGCVHDSAFGLMAGLVCGVFSEGFRFAWVLLLIGLSVP